MNQFNGILIVDVLFPERGQVDFYRIEVVTPFIRIVGRDAVTRDSVCQHHDVVAFGIQRQRDRCRAGSRWARHL
ncbi:Uncharacterised protein [Chlamydia trachomatis]|nr:Uncharacterised protein [Chlamydia trachomatis]